MEILNKYLSAPRTKEFIDALQNYEKIKINNLNNSALSFLFSSVYKLSKKPLLLIFSDKEEAAYYFNDLENILGENKVLFFPESYRRAYQIEKTDNANVLLRSKVLSHLQSRQKPQVVVTYSAALFEKVIIKQDLKKHILKIKTGDLLSLDFMYDMLLEYKFELVDFVSEPGEFAVRGGIIDVFSYGDENPYRIEFYGDQIESIRTFDVETQLSDEIIKTVQIIPNLSDKLFMQNRRSFLEFIKKNTLIFVQNEQLLQENLDQLFKKAEETFTTLNQEIRHLSPEELFINSDVFQTGIQNFKTIYQKTSQDLPQINFNIQPQPFFNKNFELLTQNLSENTAQGFQNIIFCSNDEQVKRLQSIFDEWETELTYQLINFPIYSGFIDKDNQLVCYTDHQIFGRYHRFKIHRNKQKKQSVTLQEITGLKEGDYVTHIDHGIGQFGGLQKIEQGGKEQEVVEIIYKGGDRLFVSIHSLHKISKYNAKDGIQPKIHKLGSGAWKLLKQKTKKRLKKVAFDIIKLYAERKLQKGTEYAADSFLQYELEASFFYEDTPDQLKATQDIKRDMESDKVMDRLVCGDVGFGKTEVAIRAAFKAVDNGKQVAVLVPTTILAFQHFKTFSERLKNFPVVVDYINRFRTAKEKKKILQELSEGKIDIIIGTHALVNDKVKYKDLGLMIIDEEQKFGVSVKEKLKTIRKNVDTLTLTATPIPRTLQFSLMNERDLSVINTAPPNRYPIETQVIRFDEELIRDAILYELERKGQIFFINNQIENIKEVAGMLQRLVPDARIAVGHGQMDGKKLEALMFDFMNGEYDILVSTTIIESGLDVPNANTIFINNAHQFGLSDLHQMRGRVGRSNKKAFCYFITPPYSVLTPEARKRMQAIETYTELGSGFQIAMKDLEIRGAGDLLGADQSGFINDMGFDTYQKILKEAISELENNEFKDLFKNKPKETFKVETQLDMDFEILFPTSYIESATERLKLYNELSQIKTEEALHDFQNNLQDRFGKIPQQTSDLLESIKLKWIAEKLGFEKLVLKKSMMLAYFVSDTKSTYFDSPVFHNILKYIQEHPKCCRIIEKNIKNEAKTYLKFEKINSIDKALKILSEIMQYV